MDEKMNVLFVVIESHWWLASLGFILFHILRQVLFIPVVIICIAGGALFGGVIGSIYSVAGLTLSSLFFYFLYQQFPGIFGKILRMKERLFGNRANFSVGQITVMRLIPFIHFHLLSLCLIETTKSFSHYAKASLLTNIPLAIIYTVFGQFITEFSPTAMLVVLIGLLLLMLVMRQKVVVMKWEQFFHKEKQYKRG
ncbi:TVP38/TMEM64 family protein [Sutcliffiella horikoshii]|uniref:TVP38/TMEM64 family protein n=1 Tax=Sutcliffiella horikoshii TaxID=79883 RepID=UPI001CBAC557|nr:VTT domain-containing protein [Sutcliffiella horikoshii]UAL46475.1 VTT domain-containing protein [Sutcliffiella horikoshii]